MQFDLGYEALRASGVNNTHQISDYLDRLHSVYLKFVSQTELAEDPLIQAKQLFDWLWTVKPFRYKRHGNFRISDVIESQMNEKTRSVGNCLGLTILYNCLLKKTGLYPEAIYLEEAFGNGPHVLTCLRTKHSVIDIENILPQGFDYQYHKDAHARTLWSDKELVADIYHSRGNECFEMEKYSEALTNYKMAVQLNPQYQKAHFNIAILLDKLTMDE